MKVEEEQKSIDREKHDTKKKKNQELAEFLKQQIAERGENGVSQKRMTQEEFNLNKRLIEDIREKKKILGDLSSVDGGISTHGGGGDWGRQLEE